MDIVKINPPSEAPQPRKRRQTMAEMLRESMLMESTVSLVDAVESAQAATARKLEAEEAAARQAANPQPAAAPEPPAFVPAPPAAIAPVEYAAPAPAPAPAVPYAPASTPLAGVRVNRYNLYARQSGRWIWQTDIQASSHAEGMQRAIAWLKPEHDSLPIRLEQDEAVV